MKLFGGILICVSTAAIGLRVGNAERIRYQSLCGMIFALDLMIAEISCLLTPVKVLFEKLSAQAPKPINQFFYKCMLLSETRSEFSVTQIWTEAIREADYLHLKETDLQILQEICQTFGHYHSEDQVTILRGIRSELESLKETAKEEQSRNSRIYRSLGITCGIALAILLI